MPNLYAIPNKFHSLSISAIPTATSVRIAGLLTGSPSNYLEGLKTFINDKLQIDNLVTQLYKKYKHKISFFGDRTWVDFCPILSTCPHFTIDPYAKTNLVENETKAMSEFIKRINQDKAVLGHFISLDAFGHLHGTHHIEMRNSLERFDKFIKQVYDKMDDNTLLVLTSDHGITDEGEHGGVSKPEMSSFISLISKRGIKLKTVSDQIKKTRQSYLSSRYDSDDSRMVHQDDILPTVCYLMDLCLPTNSYGNVIYEVVDDFEYLEWFVDKKRELLNRDVSGDDVKRDENLLKSLGGEKENFFDGNKNKKNIIKTKSCIDETVVKELFNKKTNKINKHD
ncbi:MAG: alkaline phosphatase family protein, partial [Lactobacillaceae bacterium]